MRTERAAALACSALLLSGLTACSTATPGEASAPSSSASARTPKEVLQAAAETLDKGGSANIRVEEDEPAFGHTTVVGSLAWGDRSAADLTISENRGKGQLKVVAGVYYVTYDWLPSELHGKHWAMADRALAEALDTGDTSGGGTKALTGIWLASLTSGLSGPLRQMAQAGQVTAVGKEAGGMHYRATAPVAGYSAADTGMTDAERAKTLAYYQRTGVQALEFDFWIDESGELASMVETARGSAGTDRTTTTLAQLGLSVPVQAPPAADTVDLGKR